MANCKAKSLVCACGIAALCVTAAFCADAFLKKRKNKKKFIKVQYVFSQKFDDEMS